ncbi:MAG: lipoyl synthase, partial [bacterium]
MKPYWFSQKIQATPFGNLVRKTVESLSIRTICTEAKCPNRNFCFSRRSLTFLILGETCTRNCFFCSVKKGKPEEVDPSEPKRIAEACKTIGLKHIVITSVTRDDLPDGGANHFANVVRAIRDVLPDASIEVLVPDFMGRNELIDIVLFSPINIFGHNIETVPRLYKKIRPKADYARSMSVLSYAAQKGFRTKTAIMVGCGETKEEVFSVIREVSEAGIKYIVIG